MMGVHTRALLVHTAAAPCGSQAGFASRQPPLCEQRGRGSGTTVAAGGDGCLCHAHTEAPGVCASEGVSRSVQTSAIKTSSLHCLEKN